MPKIKFSRKTLSLLLVLFPYTLSHNLPLNQTIAGSKMVELSNTKQEYNIKCTYSTTANSTGICECSIIHHEFKNFICKCTDASHYQTLLFACGCVKTKSSDDLNNCQCLSPEKKINVSCGSKTKNIIKLGILLPYTFHKNIQLSAYYSGLYYASAMFVAVNDINNKLLPKEYSADFVWGNTNCETNKTISLAMKMMEVEHVDAIIGAGCDSCLMTAQLAAIKDISMVSHLCTEEELSDKTKYPTFARTGVYTNSVSATIQTLLDHFKWKNVGVIYEENIFFKKTFSQFKTTFKGTITTVKSIPSSPQYYADEHYELAKSDLQNVSKAARIIICLMGWRVLKEILVAAGELQLTDASYVFLTYELDYHAAFTRQERPFRWITVEYAPAAEGSQQRLQTYVERSKTLCNVMPNVLMLSSDISNYQRNDEFRQQVREEAKNKFNSTVYGDIITGTSYIHREPPPQARLLYDAIMLYATAVNDTINNNQNFHSGKTVMENMKNKTFRDVTGFDVVVNRNLDARLPLALYHWGRNKSSINACHMNDSYFPQMHAIAHFQLKESTNKTEYYYVPIPDAPMYWPGDTKLENIKDTFEETKPTKGGGKKKETMKVAVPIVTAIIGIILIISIITLVRRCRSQRPKVHRKISTEDLIEDDQNFDI